MSTKITEPKSRCFSMCSVRVHSSKWRKASKCKQQIENLVSSIKVQRRRRETMVRQSRSDIAQLIANGRILEARPKAKQFYDDEKKILGYDKVENFCTSLLQNFPHVKQSDVYFLPEETKEAMAGLIFAASRIGELGELQYIRSLIAERFGLDFDKECVDLRPGNLVSMEIIKILDTNMPQDMISREMIIGISKKNQTNVNTTPVDSNEDSAIKGNSKFVRSDIGGTQGRDRSSIMR